jgi:DNA polymerase-3 subunit gamma/tau
MSYLVLARKWRPKSFKEVVGQQHVLRALINGLDQNRLHHAFLFSGTRGVGKTTLARIFAKSLNCEQGVSSTPCGECQSCIEVDQGRFVDLIEVDGASKTKVDDTRELLDNVQYAPSRGRYKVYLIDEVHMLSTHSFNALLKTLEEPPEHVKFLFATTDPQKLPVTILSRCLQFNLRRLLPQQICDHLTYILEQEALNFDRDALKEIARAADGSMRDALSLLDQAIAFGGGQVNTETVFQMLGSIHTDQLYPLLSALAQQDAEAVMQQSEELSALGRDYGNVLDAMLNAFQQIATLQQVPTLQDKENYPPSLLSVAEQLPAELVQLFYQITLHGKRDLVWAADPRSGFEMTLLRILSFQPRTEPAPAAAENAPIKKPKPVSRPVSQNSPQQPETHKSEAAIVPELIKATVEPAPLPTIDDASTAPAPASVPNIDVNADNWTQIIASLKLSALARQLAEHAAFVSAESNVFTLTISRELNHLATDKSKQKLQQVLSQHLGETIKLVFTDGNEQQSTHTTLAKEKATEEAQRQEQAFASIQNDPAIEIIKNTFDARIIEASIKPIEDN